MTAVKRASQTLTLQESAVRSASRNERIHALSDGVFSIVITLMAFQVQVPNVPPNRLQQALVELIPTLQIYVVSFVVLGIYWVGQHNMFMHIKRHDRVFLWLNILFLLFVALMPWPAGLVIRYPGERISVIVYALILCFAGLSLDLLWWYATRNRHLVEPDIDPALVVYVHRRVLVAPAIYLLAIPMSFINIRLAELLFVVVAILYIVPNPLDRYHHRQLSKVDEEG